MGVDCNLYLGVDVRPEDVADAMAIILGEEKRKCPLGGDSVDWYVGTDVKVEPSIVPGMATIRMPKGQNSKYSPSFHFSVRHEGRVYNLLKLSSSPKRIAIAYRLAGFFGGIVEANDSTGKTRKFERTCPVDEWRLISEDGNSWQAFQQALFDLAPLEDEEVKAVRNLAGYRGEG